MLLGRFCFYEGFANQLSSFAYSEFAIIVFSFFFSEDFM